MELKILWTQTASNQLEEVFDYFKITANVSIARKLVRNIVYRTASLAKHPRKGQREPLLANRKKEYRYIIEGNYKIIYWIDEAAVHVAAVFDTRQNPEKIKKAE